MSMKRFRVAENSMVPALTPGDEVVAVDSRPAKIGELVVLEHPDRPDFWLIKRRVEPPHQIAAADAWVLSDNQSATRADSRSFGSIDESSLLPVIDTLNSATFAEACRLLADEDPSLAQALATHGVPPFWTRPPGFACLTLLILEQQVSLESGAAMYRRLLQATDEVTPESIAGFGPQRLRGLGITRQKTEYLIELAAAVLDGSFDVDTLGELSVDDARVALLGQKGIGPWTADAYLLSALGHIDIFPVGDRALQVGTAELAGMAQPPTPDELEKLTEPWKPVRAAAARLIWHAYLKARGRAEPGDVLLRTDPTDVRRVKEP